MKLYVLVKEIRYIASGDFETELLYAGSQEACRIRLGKISESGSLGFDMTDPDTWIKYDVDGGVAGEIDHAYRIKEVEAEYDERRQICRSEGDETEKLRNALEEVTIDRDTWRTKFEALMDAINKIVDVGSWFYSISRYKKERDFYNDLRKS